MSLFSVDTGLKEEKPKSSGSVGEMGKSDTDGKNLGSVEGKDTSDMDNVHPIYEKYCSPYLDHILEIGPPMGSLFATSEFYAKIPVSDHAEVARMVSKLNSKIVGGKNIGLVETLGLQSKFQECHRLFLEKRELVQSGISLENYNSMKQELEEVKEQISQDKADRLSECQELKEQVNEEQNKVLLLSDTLHCVAGAGKTLQKEVTQFEDKCKDHLLMALEEQLDAFRGSFRFLSDEPPSPEKKGRELFPGNWSSSEEEEE